MTENIIVSRRAIEQALDAVDEAVKLDGPDPYLELAGKVLRTALATAEKAEPVKCPYCNGGVVTATEGVEWPCPCKTAAPVASPAAVDEANHWESSDRFLAGKVASEDAKDAALATARNALVQWHVPENRYAAIEAIDSAMKGEKE